MSETDPLFLEPLSTRPENMPVKRCSVCHLYIDGAPSPHLVHDGKFGASCLSRHHPDPCDYSSREHGLCSFFMAVESKEDEAGPGLGNLSPHQLHARDEVRQEEMNRMAAELVAMKEKQEAMDNMAAEMVQMKEMMKALRTPAPGNASLAGQVGPLAAANLNNICYVTTQPTTTITSTAPSLVPPQLSGSAVGQLGAESLQNQSSLLEDVLSHIQKNTSPPVTSQPRGAYSGPTMPAIRKDEQLDAIAMKVLAALESRIPQIKESFATVTTPHPRPPTHPDIYISGAHTRSHMQHHSATNTIVTTTQNQRPLSSAFVLPPRPSQDTTFHPAYAALAAASGGVSDSHQWGGTPSGGGPGDDFLDASAIMQLCTVSNRRQVRPHEFAKMGRFSYASKITDKNITVPLYVMGYLQHVVALLKGVVPVQSETEVVDRLTNLLTIMEITANNSTLDDFKCHGWSIGLEYAGRIFHDIEYGRLKWENLSEGLQPHTFLYAKDTVEMQQGKPPRGNGQSQQRGRGRGQGRGQFSSRSDRSDESQDNLKICQSYNGFFRRLCL